ncbi:hypothetical protein DPMN_060106 [Dreissena polymorpha]|uniref:Uncharacterized protein n=1 Tax=Dreissena polymorpha TaxID=45954 RepID=A0A9D4C4L7_DREPO|nr:hypothetical protein DPMN_060106 [Dreissena polymorpha]
MPVASRQSAVLLMHRSYAGIHRGVAVALPGSVWAPVEVRCRPGCSRCHAGRCRSFPVTPGGIKHFNTFPVEPRFIPVEHRFIPVEPRFIPVDAGSRTGASPAS